MAEARTAWGIDIGQAGLKAIKLRVDGEGDDAKVRAVAFDYIAHPKILSQPDAVPGELIAQSVETFLARNKVSNDLIALSVPGQTSLAKFIKLPPVEPGKVAEIVKYEAKQQIPFDLEEVVWDYQTIGGGVEESGFMLEAEVGLFAMKRDLVYEAMDPLTEHKAEIDLVQVAPLALYNYLSYDVLRYRVTPDQEEPPNAEEYFILLDMGADNTTLMVSNGRNIWIRNVPIGGNHFTRALTREMKLTFAKAEHLKCNATKAPDPKAVFQAMRPVFNDYVTEIQRSIGYFGSVNRSAKIVKVIGVGNGFKMAGLQKFLQQNLQYEVIKLDDFRGIKGDSVLSDPLFIDNVMTFAVPYGLALQALKQTRIHTSLLPPEIVVQRTIRRKKPWAVGVAAGLLLTLGISTFASAFVHGSLSEDRWADGHKAVADLKTVISGNTSAYAAQTSAHEKNLDNIERLTAPLENRKTWLELMNAIDECLPRPSGDELDETDTTLRRQIHIESFTQLKVKDVAEWHKALVQIGKGEDFVHDDDAAAPPSGKGYIVTLTGYHFYNSEEEHYEKTGANFVDNTLGTNLRKWKIDRGDGSAPVPVGQIGISHPIIVDSPREVPVLDPRFIKRQSPTAAPTGGPGGARPGGSPGGRGGLMGRGGRSLMGRGDDDEDERSGMGTGQQGSQRNATLLDPLEELQTDADEKQRIILKTSFTLQFAWIPVPNPDDRLDEKPEAAAPAAAPAEEADDANYDF